VRTTAQAQSAPTCSCQGVGAETPPQGRLGQALLPTAHPTYVAPVAHAGLY